MHLFRISPATMNSGKNSADINVKFLYRLLAEKVRQT